jgi:hypothetical protein
MTTRMLQMHVFECFRCFIGMLQVFYMDVVKVDRDVASVLEICCKRPFKMFHLIQTYVATLLCGCCICFSGYTHMLQVVI